MHVYAHMYVDDCMSTYYVCVCMFVCVCVHMYALMCESIHMQTYMKGLFLCSAQHNVDEECCSHLASCKPLLCNQFRIQ